jgi:LmbE family N-acetylglucosaminyl deacetylase
VDRVRILLVTAHPDDVDFGCGGSVAGWTAEGHEVAYCICTSGEAGEAPPEVPRPDVPARREAEQRAAAAVLGVSDVTFLHHADGRLEPTLDLRRDISRVIRRFRPDRVVSQSPERVWERVYASHPDHLAAGVATMAAVYPDARNAYAHPELLAEGLEPWAAGELYVMGPATGGGEAVFVDTTDAIDKKVAALRAHASQTAHMTDLEERMRGWGAMVAQAGGLPEGRLAEAFRRIDAR